MKLQLNSVFTKKEEVILSQRRCQCVLLGWYSCLQAKIVLGSSPTSEPIAVFDQDCAKRHQRSALKNWSLNHGSGSPSVCSLSNSSFCLNSWQRIILLSSSEITLSHGEQPRPLAAGNASLGSGHGVICSPTPAAPQNAVGSRASLSCLRLCTKTQVLSQRTDNFTANER